MTGRHTALAQAARETPRAAIRGMPAEAAVELLLHLLEEMTFDPARHSLSPLPGVRLTPTEARLVRFLDAARGGWRTLEQIMQAVYGGRGAEAEWPDEKILDVVICKARAKLRPHGTIVADFARRRRLELAEGVALDWSCEA